MRMLPSRLCAIVWIALLIACGSNTTPTTPTAPTAPTVVAKVVLTGIVSAAGGAPLPTATVTVLDGANAARSATTDSNGRYTFTDLVAGDANLSAAAPGYNGAAAGVLINGTNTLSFTLQTTQPWTQSGVGDSAFMMPTYISRVHIVATFTGSCSNIIVAIGGKELVNEIIGMCFVGIGTHYDGTFSTTGGAVSITNSTGVSWSLTEAR
jgi:hypothetical protein